MPNTLFQQLPPVVLRTCQRRKLAPGDLLFTEGSSIQRLFFVERGCVRVVVQPVDGKELVLYRARDGELIAEDHLVRNAHDFTAIADQKTEVVSVSHHSLLDHITTNKTSLKNYLSMLSERNEQLRQNFARLALPKATDRVLHLFRSLMANDRAIDLTGRFKTLASDLNMTHETMYRSLRTLENAGAISRNNGWVTVHR